MVVSVCACQYRILALEHQREYREFEPSDLRCINDFAFMVTCFFFINKFLKRTDKGEQKSLVFMQLIRRLIISYFTIGLLFSITGYIERAIENKPEVFSPLVGIPFDIIGWPWSLRGYTVHNNIGFQAFTTWFSFALALIIVLYSSIKDC